MSKTLDYYNENAEAFCENTVNADMSSQYNMFEKYMFDGARVLDFGCGSGRDTKYFIEQGYHVEAIDGSEELCKRASVAKFAEEQGYYAGESGTSWTLMSEGVQSFGIWGEELGLSRSEVFSALESGCPIICSMRPGDFTTTGHFIVLTKVENGKIKVNDPNSRIRSGQLWDYERLEPQIQNLWAFSRM